MKLKSDTISALPTTPGVYRFFNAEGSLIYIGKAKNLRRRLGQYRNAKRRKAHAKMSKITKEATRLEYEICTSERDALTLENKLIQEHRPKWNVAGAFYFLYPMIGIKFDPEGKTPIWFCYTTTPQLYPDFSFHGAFRSRTRTRDAFFAMIELLRMVGHSMNKSDSLKLGHPLNSRKTGYVYGFRQVPIEWQVRLHSFLSGENLEALQELSLLLLDRPTAIRECEETENRLKLIRRFWRHEITALKRARDKLSYPAYPVQQKERDALFIAYSFERRGAQV